MHIALRGLAGCSCNNNMIGDRCDDEVHEVAPPPPHPKRTYTYDYALHLHPRLAHLNWDFTPPKPNQTEPDQTRPDQARPTLTPSPAWHVQVWTLSLDRFGPPSLI